MNVHFTDNNYCMMYMFTFMCIIQIQIIFLYIQISRYNLRNCKLLIQKLTTVLMLIEL